MNPDYEQKPDGDIVLARSYLRDYIVSRFYDDARLDEINEDLDYIERQEHQDVDGLAFDFKYNLPSEDDDE